MSQQPLTTTIFPFLSLPPEVRNVIYSYLFHKGKPITLTAAKKYETTLGLRTSVLRTNHQIHRESVSILYHQNTCVLSWDNLEKNMQTICRVDREIPITRNLPSGQTTFNALDFEGAIYAHILHRFTTLGMTMRWCTNKKLTKQCQYTAEVLKNLLVSPLSVRNISKDQSNPRTLIFELTIWGAIKQQFKTSLCPHSEKRIKIVLLRDAVISHLKKLADTLGRNLVITGPFSEEFKSWVLDVILNKTSVWEGLET